MYSFNNKNIQIIIRNLRIETDTSEMVYIKIQNNLSVIEINLKKYLGNTINIVFWTQYYRYYYLLVL